MGQIATVLVTHAPLLLRPGEPDDRPIVADAWHRSYGRHATVTGPFGDSWVRHGNGWLAPNLHHAGDRHVIDELLARPGLALIVGHLEGAADVVASWCAFEVLPFTVHYAWTRPELQRRGYGRQVLATALEIAGVATLRCSHMTAAGERLIRAHRRGPACPGTCYGGAMSKPMSVGAALLETEKGFETVYVKSVDRVNNTARLEDGRLVEFDPETGEPFEGWTP